MSIEPATEAESHSAGQKGVYATPPVNEHGTANPEQGFQHATDSIVLYIVGSSAGLRQGEALESTFEWSTAFDEMTMW